VTFKELHEHAKASGAKWCEVFKGNGQGTGVICFGTAEEVAAVVRFLCTEGGFFTGAQLSPNGGQYM